MLKIKKVMKILKDMLNHWKEVLLLIVDALVLWSLNLLIPLVFSLVTPLLVKNISDVPLVAFKVFRYWFVEGFEMQIAIFIWCLVFCVIEKAP